MEKHTTREILRKMFIAVRKYLRLTQAAFARLLEREPKYISKVETGKVGISSKFLDHVLLKAQLTHEVVFNLQHSIFISGQKNDGNA